MTTIRLGKKLIALRRDANMTQEELAAYMGVSKSSVSKWETETTPAGYPAAAPAGHFV